MTYAYGKQYKTLKRARFLFALLRTIEPQLGEKPEEKKTYKVEIEGRILIMLRTMTEAMFRETRNLESLGF